VFKLLVTLGTFLLVALALFGLRQHRLELTSECAKIHSQIKNREEVLLDQRVEIARKTNPWALAAGLEAAGLHKPDALVTREGRTGRPRPGVTQSTPAVETDLLAPLRDTGGSGHSNPSRPRQ
jgi:hypothetical protein